MAKEWAKAFYKSDKWLKCRAAYIAERINIDGGLCEDCQKNMGYIVHHIEKLTPENINDTEVTLNFDNLRFVCKDCHDKYPGHGLGKHTEQRIYFDDNGMPQPILPP